MTIEDDKRILGFKSGNSGLYKQWRNAIKARMITNGFTSRREAGIEKWAELTEFALTLKPLSARAGIHGTATAAGFAMQQALNSLLGDAGKKLKDTQTLYKGVDLVDTSGDAPVPGGMFSVF